MSSYGERLNRLEWRERFGLTWKIALVAVCALIFFVPVLLLYVPVSLGKAKGTVIAQHGESSEEVIHRYLMVRLDSGSIVRARFDGQVPFRVGHRVALREITTSFFGYKWYKFNGYLEETSDSTNPIQDVLKK